MTVKDLTLLFETLPKEQGLSNLAIHDVKEDEFYSVTTVKLDTKKGVCVIKSKPSLVEEDRLLTMGEIYDKLINFEDETEVYIGKKKALGAFIETEDDVLDAGEVYINY